MSISFALFVFRVFASLFGIGWCWFKMNEWINKEWKLLPVSGKFCSFRALQWEAHGAVRQEVQLSGGIPPISEFSAPFGNTGDACGRVSGPSSSRLIGWQWTIRHFPGALRLLVWWQRGGIDRNWCCRVTTGLQETGSVQWSKPDLLSCERHLVIAVTFQSPGNHPDELLFIVLLLTFCYLCIFYPQEGAALCVFLVVFCCVSFRMCRHLNTNS